jgi:polyphosphate kinase
VTRALYRASMAGVKVDLIIRDTCRLRPGIAGLSDSVRVVSIVGRFLEHGRIYYFRNGGNDEYYIGSADLMKRNLESRVEVITPVEDPVLRKELRTVLDCQLAPNECAWEMQSDGSYVRHLESEANCQEFLIGYVDQQLKEAAKRKRRKSRGFARRAIRNGPRENEE